MSDDDEHTANIPLGELLSDLATQEGQPHRSVPTDETPESSETMSVRVAREPMEHDEPTQRVSLEMTEQMRIPGAPEHIGRYRVLSRLGAGGMAEIFLASQVGPDGFEKEVVVKRSLPHLRDSPRFVEMFLREARIAARLDHPNIVQIYELGEDGADYFIAMEHVQGLSLHRLARRAWRKETAVPMEVVLRAVADAAAGLGYAHELTGPDGTPLALVHRDISPDNLMMNREGVTKLLDFGIAKAADTETLTKTGEIKGKIPFMSPEQIRGETLDHRTDLYALGVCLYWLLAGRRPFAAASDFLTMNAVLEEEARPPSAFNPQVPADVDAIALRLLAKSPVDRFQSGRELADALAALIPPGHDEAVSFLADALTWADPPPGELTITGSGFVPATPSSSQLRRSPFPTGDTVRVPPSKRRRSPWLPVVVGAGSTFLGVGVAVVIGLALTDSEAGETTEENQPSVVAKPVPPEPPPPEPAAADPAPADPAPDDPAPDDPAPEDPAPDDPAPDDEPDETPPSAQAAPPAKTKSPASRRRRARPAVRRVKASGPPGVRWVLGGRTIGRGSTNLTLPPGTDEVVARNPALGHEVVMPVADGLDYGALPEGNVQFRVFPYAEVKLGAKKLGTTPMRPQALAIGRYRVKLLFEDQVFETTLRVKKGARAVVKKSFEQQQ